MLSTERIECFHSYFAVHPMFLLIIWVYYTVHICVFQNLSLYSKFTAIETAFKLVWTYEDIN